MASKWVRPEVSSAAIHPLSSLFSSVRLLLPCLAASQVYPLFAATGVAIGICAFSLLRNITGNPEVRVSKMGRAAGVLENHEEGRRYAEHGLRAYVQDKTPEIMPGINKFFTSPK
uniref:Uncharacterized protein n=1 Tax=Hordeum vulgare subsp. vulgare TaxID=112509 RepID=A0A8I6Y6P1_HORVV